MSAPKTSASNMNAAWPFIWQSLARVKSVFSVAALALLLNGPIHSQAPGQLPKFEVASIKPNKTNERIYYGLRNGTLTVRNMTVKGLIQVAYGKRDFQIIGGPDWIASEPFDIDAKDERPQRGTHDMEKSLLASRFHLQLHREVIETSVYSLVVARGGLRMKSSADQTEPEKGGPKEFATGRLVGEGVPMYVIANLLSNMLGRPVVNNTGLTGKFDVNLRPAPGASQSQNDPADPLSRAEDLNIAIVEAVEKQLGLKLESIKAPDEVLIIDRIELPSAN